MEYFDEERIFWDFIPRPAMPKTFLMTGKRREEEHMEDDDSIASDHDTGNRSPHSPSQDDSGNMSSYSYLHDDSDDGSVSRSPTFSPSAGSAFSKIGKMESEMDKGTIKSTLTPPGMSEFYPGFFPPLYSSHFFPTSSEPGTSAFSPSAIYPPPFLHHTATSPSTAETKPFDSQDKNMFYYVDPRIPFTNYFLNLTKLLTGTSKEYTATTPLGKMTGEDRRADDREPTISPDSSISISGKSRAETITSPDSEHCGSEDDDITRGKKTYKMGTIPEKLNISPLADPRFINPFAGNLLQPTHPGGVLPVPGGGLFHPAFMHLPGSAYRRYNPEKPAPVKKYKCDVCGKAFSRSNTLVTHKRIHTGDKPFKCEICNRAFRQPGNLTRHRLTHTTVKPYVCPTCNKAFNRASNLHTHMRTHTSFKAYLCPYCGKGFHQKIDMKIHCYTHTAHAARPDASPMQHTSHCDI